MIWNLLEGRSLGTDCSAISECDDMQGEASEEPEPKKPGPEER